MNVPKLHEEYILESREGGGGGMDQSLRRSMRIPETSRSSTSVMQRLSTIIADEFHWCNKTVHGRHGHEGFCAGWLAYLVGCYRGPRKGLRLEKLVACTE